MEKHDEMVSDAPQATLSREELEQHLRARAWKDEAFRQEFLANPKAVLERDYAQYFPEGKLPSDLSIKVIEEEEQTLCFVLPPQISDVQDTINDELLSVSGGYYTQFGCETNISRTCNLTCIITCSDGGCNKMIKNIRL